VRAKARFPNAGSALFPGQFVNVRLLLRTIRDAVVVPVAALRHGTQGDFVYVVDTGARTVSVRGVERGRQAADRVEIVKGLQPGEVVVTEGADRLRDGARVVLPGADRAPAGDGAAARAGDVPAAAPTGSRRPPASGAPRAEAGASR
jgi:multidrug efflux system membrane fusion protein